MRPPSALAPRLAGVLLAAVAATAAAADPSLELSLEPRRFGIEDVARLTVRIVEPEGNPVVDLGELVNLEVVSGPSTGTEFSWVNGVATRATSFSYVVQGREVGQASVGPVRVVMGALELEAEAVSAEVVPGSVAPDRGAARRPPLGVDPFDDFFQRRQPSRSARVELRQLLDRREAVLGQTVTAVVVLDTTAGGVDGFEWVAPPTYPGWWAQRVDPPQRVTGEVVEVDGVRFNRFEIARHVLVPLKAGELAVPAAGARIGFRSASLFAPQQVVERSSPELTVSVAPRPPAPAGFSGAVGDLGYSVALDPEAIDFGESAVVTITLAGTGNLPLVEPPAAWPGCGDCESYPPEEESAVEVDTRGVHGSRSWRTTVVPRSAGVLELGPVELAVFDPAASRYRRQSLGPLTLTVAPPAATPVPVAAAAATGAGSGAGAAETAPRPEQPPAAGPPPWAWVVGALAAGLLVGGVPSLLLARRRRAGLPPRRAGQSPAERARELQVALERWWLDVRDSARGARLEEEMRELRRELEAVRFAPGRADHSETVADLEERLRRLMRR